MLKHLTFAKGGDVSFIKDGKILDFSINLNETSHKEMKQLTLILAILCFTANTSIAEVKKADLAGEWYSGSSEGLGAELDAYLENAKPQVLSGRIVGLISPHAGFRYSGPVAAYGFKAIKGKGIKTVIIVGFSHRKNYDGIAVLDEDGFRTPLGVLPIDREITGSLAAKHAKIYNYPEAFSEENSVEMQMPFLQAALSDFKIVLVAIGDQSFENCKIIADALYETLKDKTGYVLVGSTDMSHYLPYERANAVDKKTISLVEEFDPDKFYAESLSENHSLMCGYGACAAIMMASKMLGADKIEILKYANSGDTSGDKARVVGYLSAALVNTGREKESPGQGEKNMFNESDKKEMLKLARDSITYYLENKKRLPVEKSEPLFNECMGAFVTLHKRGQLRGCIGNMVGQGPFYLTVRDMAVSAATGDPRFNRVTLEEMKDIDIEISALTPLVKIEDPETIEPGKHGVLVRNATASGVYLPQVATEQGWNREQFMNSLCGQKAGMAPDAWKKGECEIYTFTAEVFGEKE